MKQWIRDWGVRRKLSWIVVATSAAALLTSCVIFLWLERKARFAEVERELEVLAEIFAYGSAGALEFQDRAGAEQILAGLGAEPNLLCGALFDQRGERFASYHSPGVRSTECLRSLGRGGVEFLSGRAQVAHEVQLEGHVLGTFVAVLSLDGAMERQRSAAIVVVGVLLICGLLAFLIASHSISAVTHPILELAALAEGVTATQDYSQRTLLESGDEVGVLAAALNQMLARIEGDRDLYAQRERLREINSMLANEKERALAAVRAKSEFLANMSHEIRTPMTAILGYVDLLRNGEIDESEMQRVLAIIHRNGHHLIAVINDILDISKLDSGQLTVESIECELSEILGDVGALMRERASEKRIGFSIDYDTRIPCQVQSDPTRLRQVLLNLVSNAIKFTSAGFVRVSVGVKSSQELSSAALLYIRVEDTGTGIPEDKHQLIFQAFAQADTSMTRRYGGTGLGLSISSTLARLLGGALEIERSRPGEGSVFVLKLPLPEATPQSEWIEPGRQVDSEAGDQRRPQTAECPEDLHGRILLAEDSIDNQRLVRLILRRAGLSLDIAENGRVAVELAHAARDSGFPYDLILMDMQMPELDGYSATAQLRREGHTETIVAFTAHAMVGERERCLSAGCDDFVTKPIDRAGLLRTIQGYLK